MGSTERAVELDDLIADGLEGLVDASNRYDPEFRTKDGRSVQFWTLAEFRVRGAIMDGLRRMDILSPWMRSLQRRAEAQAEQMTQELGRPPGTRELATSMGMTEQRLNRFMLDLMISCPVSLDASYHSLDGNPVTLGDCIADPNALVISRLEAEDLSKALTAVINSVPDLTEKERMVIYSSYREGVPLALIGMSLGLTESRMSLIRTSAVDKLARVLREHYTLADFV